MALKNLLLDLVQNDSETDILDKIEKYLSKPVGFFHITSPMINNTIRLSNQAKLESMTA